MKCALELGVSHDNPKVSTFKQVRFSKLLIVKKSSNSSMFPLSIYPSPNQVQGILLIFTYRIKPQWASYILYYIILYIYIYIFGVILTNLKILRKIIILALHTRIIYTRKPKITYNFK